MIRRYCDTCKVEMDDKNTPGLGHHNSRLSAELKRGDCRLKIEVIVSKDGTANKGDFCTGCIIDALSKADPRPKPRDEPEQKIPELRRLYEEAFRLLGDVVAVERIARPSAQSDALDKLGPKAAELQKRMLEGLLKFDHKAGKELELSKHA